MAVGADMVGADLCVRPNHVFIDAIGNRMTRKSASTRLFYLCEWKSHDPQVQSKPSISFTRIISSIYSQYIRQP